MTFPTKNSEQVSKIVHAAAQLFARQGYHGTSTREIARIADISENTLFRYFEHKEDLFWAALRSRLSGLQLRRDLLSGIAGDASPEIVLPQILTQLVDTAILKPELLRLIAVAFIELRWKAAAVCHEYLSPIFSAVNRYLASNIESGKLRDVDPSLLTAALATTVMLHPEFTKLIAGAPAPYSDSREAIQVYTKFWLDVLVPSELARSRNLTQIPEIPSA
ncbi:MAG TPA: TetR/AcrR family transcriptional regulator [Terracidiphilus sp.]|nr:TetR/AcrR family transcriptional regulator [Terracidiphilus sp.]